MSYASGKFAYALCDYCGQRYGYSELRKNWKGYKVCPDDYEAKEPQLEPSRHRGDAVALKDPRPDIIEPPSVDMQSAEYLSFQSVGSASGTTDMRPYPVGP